MHHKSPIRLCYKYNLPTFNKDEQDNALGHLCAWVITTILLNQPIACVKETLELHHINPQERKIIQREVHITSRAPINQEK